LSMYLAAVSLLMFIFPIVSILIESIGNKNHAGLITLTGKWFVFWAIGIRLFTAGLRQIIRMYLWNKSLSSVGFGT
jgi:hypothetical protein